MPYLPSTCWSSLVWVALLATPAAHSATEAGLYFSWEGYRIGRYKSPTPEQAEGGVRIDAGTLAEMLASPSPPALLDVQPVRWQSGIFLQTRQRYNLPGSIWLPNVGLGELDAQWSAYFREHLARLTGSDKQFPVVVYCTADCWMSWNAVKRASSWGYSNLFWFAEGTDGWRESDHELVPAHPVPLPASRNTQDTDRPDDL